MSELAEYIGIIAFAISGFFVATRNHLDLLGILISVFLTALGGGIIRDIAVDITPYTFSHSLPAIIILAVMMLMILFKFHKKASIENKLFFIISDSVGLISFSITGALVALEHNFNLTGILALSFVTAVGGGIARDVIINQVPFVFKTGFYGTVSLLIGLSVFIIHTLSIISYFTLTVIFILGIILRVIAYYRKWSIPLV
ncbi:putative membrane protein [hydrothermal vent metagenome]|uniref:Putative membrane protein n=1 Tax=hydrothermal vent metagenome TaxID=652676 RepID=A0A3B1DT36_9ZZZZ